MQKSHKNELKSKKTEQRNDGMIEYIQIEKETQMLVIDQIAASVDSKGKYMDIFLTPFDSRIYTHKRIQLRRIKLVLTYSI